jgi:DNA adenine methylase
MTTKLVESKPLLRWVGGKQRLLRHIAGLFDRDALQNGQVRYFEPFVGGGALFLELAPASAALGDANQRLIEFYSCIRDNPRRVAEIASQKPVDDDAYYRERGQSYAGRYQRAAQFLYLNRLCFNGVYRENLRGEFNVPIGRHRYPPIIVDRGLMNQVSTRLQGVDLYAGDFEWVRDYANSGDYCFLDPPYVTSHNNNGFIEYNQNIFSWADQVRLAGMAAQLVARGVRVVMTNADHPAIETLYAECGMEKRIIERQSTVSGAARSRKVTTEALYVSHAGR